MRAEEGRVARRFASRGESEGVVLFPAKQQGPKMDTVTTRAIFVGTGSPRRWGVWWGVGRSYWGRDGIIVPTISAVAAAVVVNQCSRCGLTTPLYQVGRN